MQDAVARLEEVRRQGSAVRKARRDAKRAQVSLVAVSKTFECRRHSSGDRRPGSESLGENRVQEAQGKWPALKEEFPRHRAASDRTACNPTRPRRRSRCSTSSRRWTAKRSPGNWPKRWTSRAAARFSTSRSIRVWKSRRPVYAPDRDGRLSSNAGRNEQWSRDRGADVHSAFRRKIPDRISRCSTSSPARPASRSCRWECQAITRLADRLRSDLGACRLSHNSA